MNNTKYLFFSLFISVFCSVCQNSSFAKPDDKEIIALGEKPENRSIYNLKAELKLKDTLDKTFWEEREYVNWKEEIKNWKFGFLEDQDNSPPLIFFTEDDFVPGLSKDFYWLNNGARMLVVNPLAKCSLTDLIFFANSTRAESEVAVYVNKKFKERLIVPQGKAYTTGFTKFIIRDILLSPGKNEIEFCGADESCIKKNIPKKHNANTPKSLFVQLKDDIRFENKSLVSAPAPVHHPRFVYFPERSALELLIDRDSTGGGLFLMSREVNLDLEEYPYFEFIDNNFQDTRLEGSDVFLGIDCNGDGKVDGYLNPQSLLGINLLELAKNKWRNDDWNYYSSFVVKRIVFICLDEGGAGKGKFAKKDTGFVPGDSVKNYADALEKKFFTLRLGNFDFYSARSVVVPIHKYKVSGLKIERPNGVDYSSIIDKETLIVSAYFNESEKSKKTSNYGFPESLGTRYHRLKSTSGGVGSSEEEYIELSLPVDIINPVEDRNCYLAFEFRLLDPIAQDINVLWGLDNDGDGTIDERRPVQPEEFKDIDLFTENSKDSFQKRIISLNNFKSGLRKIRKIIFRLKQDDSEEGWYHFCFRGNLEVYNKFPAVIKDNRLKEELLYELDKLDVSVLNLDGRGYGFSQIINKGWDIYEYGIAGFGNVRLGKGRHQIVLLDNDTFQVGWAGLEPVALEDKAPSLNDSPKIIFKKINQAKYEIQVRGAKGPFWLVFLESFHPQWRIFLNNQLEKEGWGIIKEHKEFGVKEAGYKLQFSPFDLKYIFAKPLTEEHLLVNLYANGWYIDPVKSNLPQDFNLVLYFWPQYLYNIGLMVAAISLICCIGSLTVLRILKKRGIH